MQRHTTARTLIVPTFVLVALFSTGEADGNNCTSQGACCSTEYRQALRYVAVSHRTSYGCGWWGRRCYSYYYRAEVEHFIEENSVFGCCNGYDHLNESCIDINECSNNNGGCQQNCNDTEGSYYCSCDTGWNMTNNGQNCSAIIDVTTTEDTYIVTRGGNTEINCSAIGGVAPTELSFLAPKGVLLENTGSNGPRFFLSSVTLVQLNSSPPLFQASRTLTISGTTFEDSGTYSCSAKNGNVTDTMEFDVFVEGIVNVTDAIIVKRHQTAVMECLALVFSPDNSTVTWWRREGVESSWRGTQVVSGGGTNISTLVLGLELLESVLGIEVVDTAHTGAYMCVVNTSYSELSADVLLLLEKERPHSPVNLTVPSIGSRWLVLEWTAIVREYSPIEECVITQESPHAADRSITVKSKLQGTSMSLSLREVISSHILPFTSYSFTVRACNHLGCSEDSKPVSVTTLQDLPTEPLSCSAVEIHSTSVSLQWMDPSMPNGMIVNYHIDYRPVASRSGIDYTLSGAEAQNCIGNMIHSIPGTLDLGPVLECTVDPLLKATNYSFMIAASTNVGRGPWCSVSIWTNEDVPEDSPMEVTGMSMTSSSITLSWEPPPANCQNGEITGYQIRFTDQPLLTPIPEEWSTETASGTAVGTTIQGLEIFTEYTICIAARTSFDQYGPCSQPVNIIKTLNDTASPPQNLNITEVKSTSLTLKWEEPELSNGIILYYQVAYSGIKLYNITEEEIVGLNLRGYRDTPGPYPLSFELLHLVPGTQYTVSVTAFNGAGGGEPSSPVVANTAVDAPPSGESGYVSVNSALAPVMVEGQRATLLLPNPLRTNGPLSHHQVVVVMTPRGVSPSFLQPPDLLFPTNDSLLTYADVGKRGDGSGPSPVAYITAEFANHLFPDDNVFVVGADGQPNDRAESYSNGALHYGTSFAFFLRTYPLTYFNGTHSQLESSEKTRQYSVFSSSYYLYISKTAVETIAYFQLRLGPIADCDTWVSTNREQKLSDIVSGVTEVVKQSCSCNSFVKDIIQSHQFMCVYDAAQVVFRAEMRYYSYTEEHTASDFVEIVATWVGEGATLVVDGLQLSVDASCPTEVESFEVEDCLTVTSTQGVFSVATIGSIGGGTAGLLVLLVLITACIAVAVKFRRKKSTLSQKNSDQTCIYDEVKGSDINVSHVYQRLPLRSNPSYGDVGLQSNPNPSYGENTSSGGPGEYQSEENPFYEEGELQVAPGTSEGDDHIYEPLPGDEQA